MWNERQVVRNNLRFWKWAFILFVIYVFCWNVDVHARVITITSGNANGDTATFLSSTQANSNFSHTATYWGNNFRNDYTLIKFAHVSDSIKGDTIIDSAAFGFIVSSENIASPDTLFPLVQRITRTVYLDTCTWDSAIKDPGGAIWTTAGAASTSGDISASILCDSTDGVTVNDPSGTVLTGFDFDDVTVLDTVWFRVATDHADSLRNNWTIRFAWVENGAEPYLVFRNPANATTTWRPKLRLWTSAPAGGGGARVGIRK